MLTNALTAATLSTPNKLTRPYSWCGHIPFAFWLISELKPRTYAELGTHTGNSYFSVCQVVEENRTNTQCFAVDTWQGDEHAGFYDDSIYEGVDEYNQRYTQFSTLLRCTFDDALEKFEDNSIDILHIDGLHTYEAVKHDFDTWLPKISDQGIVLFHDTNIKERGFGVWELWNDLSKQYPSFEFTHSCGLGVLGVGSKLPPSAMELFELEEPETSLVKKLFSRLGGDIVGEAEIKVLQTDTQENLDGIEWLHEQIKTRDQDINWLQNQAQDKDQVIDELNQKVTSSQQELLALQGSISPIVNGLASFNRKKSFLMAELKANIKGTPLAPPLYWLHGVLKKIKHGLKTLPFSNQNAKFLNSTVNHRQSILLSNEHKGWISSPLSEDEFPAVDVSIVTYNSEKWIEPFLESLNKVNYPLTKLALYFVDNGSSDNTVELLTTFKNKSEENYLSIDIQQQPNLGFGCGHDAAIQKGNNPFFLVTNVDLTLNEDAISNVVTMAVRDDENVASWELRQKPYEHPKYVDPVTLETSWSSHACILMRRSAYTQVGGYEPRIFMYGEDVELSYRLRANGYSLRYAPQAVVWHYSYASASEVKPVQFTGSSLANAYLRLRYGNIYDIAAIIPLQLALLLRGGGFPGSRKEVLKNLVKLTRNSVYFLKSRPSSKDAYFPFRAFDYEMSREGAFYEALPLPSTPPKVSIVTRTHGPTIEHIHECIASVLNQTYPNIEHIIVEDGGEFKKDLMTKIQEAYSTGYDVHYLPLDKVGRSAAGNIGLSHATGDFMMFLDEDDLLMPDHVECLVTTLLNSPNVGATYSLAWDVHTKENMTNGKPSYLEVVHETAPLFYQEFDRIVLGHHNFIPIQAILFRKSLYSEHGGFDEEMTYLEDWDLWKRYASNNDFKWVNKTTSIFHTPYELDKRVSRHLELDSAYDNAVEKDVTV